MLIRVQIGFVQERNKTIKYDSEKTEDCNNS